MNVSTIHPAPTTDRPAPVRRPWLAVLAGLLARLLVDADALEAASGDTMPGEDEVLFGRRCPYVHGLPPMY